MFAKHHAKKRLTLTLLVSMFALAVLNGCALSPQYVDIKPTIDVKSKVAAANIVIVNVQDRRAQAQLGTRGGVYKDTSYIYLSKPINETLQPEAKSALNRLGLQTQGASPQPIEMTIFLDKLSYSIIEEKLPKKVNLEAKLSLTVKRGNETHEGAFNSAKEFSYMKSPSEEENEKIINEILSETLSRLFNDSRFINFMN